MIPGARIRATSYVTRRTSNGLQLLVFDYPSRPEAGTHVPGGGSEPGERLDAAATREVLEETGITGRLELAGVLGVQQGNYDTGDSYISVYFHLSSDEPRDRWKHTVIGDDDAWDTGLEVRCRFVPLGEAAPLLRTSWHRQAEFLGLIDLR